MILCLLLASRFKNLCTSALLSPRSVQPLRCCGLGLIEVPLPQVIRGNSIVTVEALDRF